MIFLNVENKTEREYVYGIHHIPFDEKYGMKKENGDLMTEEELADIGILVDSIPEPDQLDGKLAILYVNCETKELWYEYESIPERPETIEEKVIRLEQENKELGQLTTDLELRILELEVV